MSTVQAKILIPIPSTDFDPTEVAVPWQHLKQVGFTITFASPQARPANCDQRMLLGLNLGLLKTILPANSRARAAYQSAAESEEFKNPQSWDSLNPESYDGLLLPGGHAPGMKEYLESAQLQKITSYFFEQNKAVGAICHGVVLAARSKLPSGKSVLFGKKTTALLSAQEMMAWGLTRFWLGNYYRTYPETVEAEVRSQLARPEDFMRGPPPLLRDHPTRLTRGFCVRDGNYVSARWPGDAHRFAVEFEKLIRERVSSPFLTSRS